MSSPEKQPRKFINNGQETHFTVSEKAGKRFADVVNGSMAPDIDTARDMLPMAKTLYEGLGISPKEAKTKSQELEFTLYNGTAQQQTNASEALSSLFIAYRDLNNIK